MMVAAAETAAVAADTSCAASEGGTWAAVGLL
jgi:hypothetical protein